MILAHKQNILQAALQTLCDKNYADACVMLNARTAPVAFAPLIFRRSFLLASS